MIWEHTTYRAYLNEKLGAEGTRSGLRKKLAEALPVHTTFVSQVLSGRSEFSLEQAEGINEFLGHTKDEGEYFLLLVMKDRAGSAALKRRFTEKLKLMRDERLNIKQRLKSSDEISTRDRERFYSSYLYGAIHVLTSIAGYRKVEALAEALHIPRHQAQEMIDFMTRIGVLVSRGGELVPGPKHVHIGSDSALVLKHHANWRLHTLSRLQMENKDDLHYSACVSLSREDAFKLKELLLANLKDHVGLISKSPEEEAYVYSFDFYRLLS